MNRGPYLTKDEIIAKLNNAFEVSEFIASQSLIEIERLKAELAALHKKHDAVLNALCPMCAGKPAILEAVPPPPPPPPPGPKPFMKAG